MYIFLKYRTYEESRLTVVVEVQNKANNSLYIQFLIKIRLALTVYVRGQMYDE